MLPFALYCQLALAASSFAEVLLLDADNFALADPTYLFESHAYLEHGAVLWCDMYSADETFVRLYDPLGVRPRPSCLDALVQDTLDKWLIRCSLKTRWLLPVTCCRLRIASLTWLSIHNG